VGAAITALQAFGGNIDGYAAATLLNMWAHRDELTLTQRTAVLEHFGSLR
jgi:hypothetical protein